MMYFCFNDPSPPELYTLSLHDALPISARHSPLQAGVHFDRASGCDLFFVTTEKSEREYSPRTMYQDYAISPELFHWESQHMTTADSETGRRYREHKKLGTHVVLFVRRRKRDERGM